MAERISGDFDVYMARLREAKEKPIDKRSSGQIRLISFAQESPSYNSLFGPIGGKRSNSNRKD